MRRFSSISVDFNNIFSPGSLIGDYFSASPDLKPFQSYPFDEKGFHDAILHRSQAPVNRALLLSVIREQYRQMADPASIPEKVQQNLSLLQSETTFTVTTGHQLNLFTGPLYFIYKIISAINVAKKLKEIFPAYDFVPLYWLASEDHDVDEINHIHLFGKKIEWKPQQHTAAGRILSHGIPAALSELTGMLGAQHHAEDLLNLFSKAYDEKNNLSSATRIIVHELFSGHGLLMLDPDDARLKKNFINEMQDDVVNHSAYRIVNETITGMEKKYKAQVHPREINLFYLTETGRERIVEDGQQLGVLNTSMKFSREELLKQIETHPANFSPNVVLRPLYQEKILPNIAYVGGPAEMAYWLEYKKMFEHYGAVLPVLVPRSHVMVMDSVAVQKLNRLGLDPQDILMEEEEIIKKYIRKKSGDGFSLEELKKTVGDAFGEIYGSIGKIDPTLVQSAEAEKQKVMKSIASLEERVSRAEKRNHDTAVQQIRKLKEKFFPGKMMQERYENLVSLYALYGRDFFDELMAALNPLEKKFVLLVEK